MSDLTHRRLAYLKILGGWAKLMVDHPEVNFGLSETPESLAAEEKVAEAIVEYEGGSPLSVVRDAFKVWSDVWIEQSKPQRLFG